MDAKLTKEVEKYKIPLRERKSEHLPFSQWENFSAKELLNAIQTFLEKHNLDDADLSFGIYGYDGGIDDFKIAAEVSRTDEEIARDVEYKKQRESEKRKQAKELREKRKAEELAAYERLHKKYGNKLGG